MPAAKVGHKSVRGLVAVDSFCQTQARSFGQPKTPRGRERHSGAVAEGATAPETLRPMDREGMTLWKAISRMSVAWRRDPPTGVTASLTRSGKSLRYTDRGGA